MSALLDQVLVNIGGFPSARVETLPQSPWASRQIEMKTAMTGIGPMLLASLVLTGCDSVTSDARTTADLTCKLQALEASYSSTNPPNGIPDLQVEKWDQEKKMDEKYPPNGTEAEFKARLKYIDALSAEMKKQCGRERVP